MVTSAHDLERAAEAIRRWQALLGTEAVLLGEEDRRFYGQDVHHAGIPPAAVLRPGSVDDLAAAVCIARDGGFAVLPRGGGLSYTQGYLADTPQAVTIDLTRLDRVVDVNVADGYVTVECGATWKQLDDALAPLGVRTPFWGTLSGLRATVGGGLSQGALFLGSARHGAAAESLLGLDVVLGDGTVARVGSHANRNGDPFFRQFGPDLSGLFTGDCGALGIKARATLRLVPRMTETRHVSFGFPAAVALFDCMAEIARAGASTELFAFDPGMQRMRMKRVSLAEDARALGRVMKAAGGGLEALKAGARVVLAGRSFLDEAHFSLHMSIDGRDAADADERLSLVRRIVGERGVEVPATIPQVMRANPFAEVNSMIGPGGERWVPVHGTVPLSKAAQAFNALEAVYARHVRDRERFGIDHGFLLCIVGDRGILIEPVLYWPDARLEFHERLLDRSYLERLPKFAENLPARAAVDSIRRELAECLMQLGAASFQIGRFYLFQEGLDPSNARLLAAFKRVVDPDGIMNPGVLGLR